MSDLNRVDTAAGADLSSAGSERRDLMLEELLDRMCRVHGRRRLVRLAAASVIMLGLVVGITSRVVPQGRPTSTPVVTSGPIEEKTVSGPGGVPGGVPGHRAAVVFTTDQTVLARLSVRPPSRATLLDDETLLDELAAIDRPTGMIRRGGKVWLTSNVTDPIESSPASAPTSRGAPG